MDASVGTPTYPFTGDGDTKVDKPRFDDGRFGLTRSSV
jgi:hypothetical protein